MTPPLPPPPADGRAPIERAAVGGALSEAQAWAAHSLRELSWRPTDRTSDEVLAGAEERIDGAIDAALDRIGSAVRADADARNQAARLLREAGWPDDEGLALALARARRDWLAGRLWLAARPFGQSDPLNELDRSHGELLERLRNATDDPLPLDAQARHDLDWSVAAALRVVVSEERNVDAADDERLRAAVAASLHGYDEGGRQEALAARLARRWTADDPPAVDLLMAGHLALFAALVADRIERDAATVELWLFAPDPLPVALAMRAAGEGAAAIGGALVTVAHALGRPIDGAVRCAERLHTLDPAEARALLEAVG